MDKWKDLFPKENRYFETDNGILYCGDSKEILKNFPTESIDLVVTDPPYGISADKKFDYDYSVFFDFMNNILSMIYYLLVYNGSLYIFSDYRNVHKLKVFVMDKIFNEKNFINELIWCYRTQGFNKKKWSSKHDNILYYVKNINNYTFNAEDVREDEISETTLVRYKKYIEKYNKIPTQKNGKTYWSSPYSLPKDWLIVPYVTHSSNERKYGSHPTMKPLKLIEKLVKASSNKNDIVLDPFMGSGTTAVACEKTGRRWIGIEIGKEYCEIIKKRIRGEFYQLKLDFS